MKKNIAIKVLFTTSSESKYGIETVLVVEQEKRLYAMTKREYKGNWPVKYHYQVDEFIATSDTDVDILEALKCFLGAQTANVPDDFWFDHP